MNTTLYYLPSQIGDIPGLISALNGKQSVPVNGGSYIEQNASGVTLASGSGFISLQGPTEIDGALKIVTTTDTAPYMTLDITGNSQSGYCGILMRNTAVSNGGVNFIMMGQYTQFRNTVGVFYITNDQASPIIFRTAGVEVGRIGNTGLAVGLGSGLEASAKLDIASTTQGVLLPRMTTAQKNAITSPATGLVVYDITLNKLCVYSGAAWQTITSS